MHWWHKTLSKWIDSKKTQNLKNTNTQTKTKTTNKRLWSQRMQTFRILISPALKKRKTCVLFSLTKWQTRWKWVSTDKPNAMSAYLNKTIQVNFNHAKYFTIKKIVKERHFGKYNPFKAKIYKCLKDIGKINLIAPSF